MIVTHDLEDVNAPELLASSIVKIGDATKKALSSGLSRRALIVLLKDSSGVPQNQIERVLIALESLQETYVPKPKKR